MSLFWKEKVMRRLSAALAALVLGICLHLALGGSPLVAQEPCPEGEIIIDYAAADQQTQQQIWGDNC